MAFPRLKVKKLKTSVWILTFADLLMLLFCFFALIVLLRPPQRLANFSIDPQKSWFKNEVYAETRVKKQDNGREKSTVEKRLVEVTVKEDADPKGREEIVIRASLNTIAKQPVEVYYEVYVTNQNKGATGQKKQDYEVLEPGPIQIPEGENEGTAIIKILNDSMDEYQETLLISMIEVTNAKRGEISKLKINIEDKDPPPKLDLKLSPLVVGPGETAVLNGRLSIESGKDIEVPITVLSNSKKGEEFTVSKEQFTIRPDTLDDTISFHIDENIKNLPKRLNIQVEGTETANLNPPFNQTITIVEKNRPRFVSLEMVQVENPDAMISRKNNDTEFEVRENVGKITFQAKLNRPLEYNLLVPLNIYAPKQTISDYKLGMNSLSIPQGSTFSRGVIEIFDDPYLEPEEEFVIQMGQVEGVQRGDKTSLKFLVQNNDPPPTVIFDLSPEKTNPGDTIVLTASLLQLSQLEIKLPIFISNETAFELDGESVLHFLPGDRKNEVAFRVKKQLQDLPKEVSFQVNPTANVSSNSSYNKTIIIEETLALKNCDALKKHMSENKKTFDKFLLHQDKTRCRIALPSDLSFLRGTAQINDEGGLLEAIDKLVPIIKKFYPNDQVIVAGHTDNHAFRGNIIEEGIYPDCQFSHRNLCNNWTLGSMRAVEVTLLLLKRKIEKTKITTESHADNQPSPLDPQRERYGEAIHRRVEIILVDSPDQIQETRLLFPEKLPASIVTE